MRTTATLARVAVVACLALLPPRVPCWMVAREASARAKPTAITAREPLMQQQQKPQQQSAIVAVTVAALHAAKVVAVVAATAAGVNTAR